MTIGTVIEDRYRLISEGNQQDLGMAYTAYDLQEDRLVNLRVLADSWGSGQEALDRLQLAEQSLATLAAPGLIPYEHTGLVHEQVYLVHPRTQDPMLAELLARSERFDARTAVEITIGLCEALAPLHQAGLAHGSLSPHCIVVNEGADIALLDTGLLPALRLNDTSEHRAWGRLPYISPEQASGQGIQPSSDIYVIGALLYEMLIGRPPFRAADETVLVLQHLHQEPPSLQIMDTSIPQPLAQIVYSALAKEPSSRYRNARQLAHILRAQAGPQPRVGPELQASFRPQVAPHPLPVQPIHQEHLVVPPPPAPVVGDTWSSPEVYDLDGAGAWEREEEREGVDWVMIALLVAALIAVLGLIPLWNAVYGRYVTGPAGSSLPPHRLEAGPAPALLDAIHPDSQPTGCAELDEWVVVWYNTMPSGPSQAYLPPTTMRTKHLSECREKAPSPGVQLTGQGGKV